MPENLQWGQHLARSHVTGWVHENVTKNGLGSQSRETLREINPTGGLPAQQNSPPLQLQVSTKSATIPGHPLTLHKNTETLKEGGSVLQPLSRRQISAAHTPHSQLYFRTAPRCVLSWLSPRTITADALTITEYTNLFIHLFKQTSLPG